MVESGIGLPPKDVIEFRPHHGLHLGLLRVSKCQVTQLIRDEWSNYIHGATGIVNDKIYNAIVSLSSDRASSIMAKAKEYVNLNTK